MYTHTYVCVCVYIYIYIYMRLLGKSRFEIPVKDRLSILRLFVVFLSLFKQILVRKIKLRIGRFLPRFAFHYSIVPSDAIQCKIVTALLNKPY